MLLLFVSPGYFSLKTKKETIVIVPFKELNIIPF